MTFEKFLSADYFMQGEKENFITIVEYCLGKMWLGWGIVPSSVVVSHPVSIFAALAVSEIIGILNNCPALLRDQKKETKNIVLIPVAIRDAIYLTSKYQSRLLAPTVDELTYTSVSTDLKNIIKPSKFNNPVIILNGVIHLNNVFESAPTGKKFAGQHFANSTCKQNYTNLFYRGTT